MVVQGVREPLTWNGALHFAYGNVFSHCEKKKRCLGSFRGADGGDFKSGQDNHELQKSHANKQEFWHTHIQEDAED